MSRLIGPQARFRIYTTAGSYAAVFRDLILGRAKKGEATRDWEKAVADYVGAASTCCVPRARCGIYWVLRKLIQPGQKVILSPYTIADVVNMVLCAGGRPVFADIQRETCNIDPAEIDRLADEDTGAVLVTHLYGLACDMPRIRAICDRHGVPLIEDAAQAFGARIGGQYVGTFGDVGIFSFGMYKNLNMFEGGMIVAARPDLCEEIRREVDALPYESKLRYAKRVGNGLIRDVATHPAFFRTAVWRVIRFGHCHDVSSINRLVTAELDLSRKEEMPRQYLCKLMPMQARLGLAKLGRVEGHNAVRIEAARMYHEGLSDLPGLVLPPDQSDGSHIYSYYPIQYRDRPALYDWMIRRKRDVGIQHLKNCAELPAFDEFGRECPHARETAKSMILLPTYPRYSKRQIGRNIDVIREFFRVKHSTGPRDDQKCPKGAVV